jgi:hypothetical protein
MYICTFFICSYTFAQCSEEEEVVESLEYNSSFYGEVPPLPPYRPKQWKLLQMMIDGSSAGTNEERGLHCDDNYGSCSECWFN